MVISGENEFRLVFLVKVGYIKYLLHIYNGIQYFSHYWNKIL